MPTTHPSKRTKKASTAAGVGVGRHKPKAQAKRPHPDDSDGDPSDDEDVLMGEVPAEAGRGHGESYANWAGRVGCTLCEDCGIGNDESPTMILSPFMWCGVGAHGLREQKAADGGPVARWCGVCVLHHPPMKDTWEVPQLVNRQSPRISEGPKKSSRTAVASLDLLKKCRVQIRGPAYLDGPGMSSFHSFISSTIGGTCSNTGKALHKIGRFSRFVQQDKYGVFTVDVEEIGGNPEAALEAFAFRVSELLVTGDPVKAAEYDFGMPLFFAPSHGRKAVKMVQDWDDLRASITTDQNGPMMHLSFPPAAGNKYCDRERMPFRG